MPDSHPPDPTEIYAPPVAPSDSGPGAPHPAADESLAAGASVLRALGASLPLVPRVHLCDPDDEQTAPVAQPASPAMLPGGEWPPSAGRHQILGEIARGGMGVILKGRDVDLGRDVAVKVLLDTYHGRVELTQRFLEEAQITGQLQHPGVAPVYELGMLADRRPYFTMKLVKGQTLAALLRDRRSPADEWSRFLTIFGQVCQALAYAHARGVIHRDLKPANVMVGAFGEVQVMDWGLAKVLRRGGVADEILPQQEPATNGLRTPPRQTEDELLGSQTRAGSVLGTPAYMAPEQARGHVALVDERADVFGLGAILCEILTGKPPFTGSGAEVQHQAETALLAEAHARLEQCGAEADLVALARRCLSAEPRSRPRHAGEVAAAVTAYQHSAAERVRQAEVARAAEAARAEEAQATAAQERRAREAAEGRAAAEQRARRLTLALAAVGLLLVMAGGATAARWWQQRTAAGRDVEAALALAKESREAGRWAEATAALERAEARLEAGAPASLRAQVRQARADADMVAALERIRLGESQIYKGEGRFDPAGADRLYAQAFAAYGMDPRTPPAAEAAGRIRASAIRDLLMAGLDDWIRVEPSPGKLALRAVADAADENPWRLQLRSALVAPDITRLEEMARHPQTLAQPPSMLVWLADALTDAGRVASAATILRQARQRHPEDFWIHFSLGVHLFWRLPTSQPAEAAQAFRTAVALRPESAVAHSCLGAALTQSQDLDGGLAEIRHALELDPHLVAAYVNWAVNLSERKDRAGAVAVLRRAIALGPPTATPHNNLGVWLRDEGRLDEAIAEFRTAVRLQPANPLFADNLASTLAQKQDGDAALAEYRRFVEANPANTYGRVALARHLARRHRRDQAIAELREAIRRHPSDAAHTELGVQLHDAGRFDEAVAELRLAARLAPRLAEPHRRLAQIFEEKKDPDGALMEAMAAVMAEPDGVAARGMLLSNLLARGGLEAARQVWEQVLERHPRDHGLWHGYAELCLVLGHEDVYRQARRALLQQFADTKDPYVAERTARTCLLLPATGQELAQAVALIERAVAVVPPEHPARPYFQVAQALAEYRQGRPEKALPLLVQAAPRVSPPARLSAHLLRAMAQWRQGRQNDARALYADCLWPYKGREPENPEEWTHQILRREAEALILPGLPAFLQGTDRPRDPATWAAFGTACYARRQFLTMARRLAEAFADHPELADGRHPALSYRAARAAVLAASGHGKGAAGLSMDERMQWRRRALDWLKAELAAYAAILQQANPSTAGRVRDQLQAWVQDSDLKSVRDKELEAGLTRLEQEEWRRFWEQARALSQRARADASRKESRGVWARSPLGIGESVGCPTDKETLRDTLCKLQIRDGPAGGRDAGRTARARLGAGSMTCDRFG